MTSVTFAPALRSSEGSSSPARSLRGSKTLFPAMAPASSAASRAALNSAGTSGACKPSFSSANRVAEPTAANVVCPPLGQHPSARHLPTKNVTALALVKLRQLNFSSEPQAPRFHSSPRPDGYLAAAFQSCQHGPLRLDRHSR